MSQRIRAEDIRHGLDHTLHGYVLVYSASTYFYFEVNHSWMIELETIPRSMKTRDWRK